MEKVNITTRTSPDIINEVIEWVFSNTKGRFTHTGLPSKMVRKINIIESVSWTWYFEDADEAVLFKLRWGN